MLTGSVATKYHGSTSRISATSTSEVSIRMPYNTGLSAEKNHEAAAKLCVEKLNERNKEHGRSFIVELSGIGASYKDVYVWPIK